MSTFQWILVIEVGIIATPPALALLSKLWPK